MGPDVDSVNVDLRMSRAKEERERLSMVDHDGEKDKACKLASALGRVVIALLLALGMARSGSVSAQEAVRNVLMLNSYHHGLSWTDNLVEAVRSTLFDPELNPIAGATELYIEYMDTKRLGFDAATEQQWYDYLATKYADMSLDLILVTDNNAFDFIRAHRDQLFPGTPVIFCGINFFQSEDLDGLDQVTGVVEQTDARATINVALDLHPNTDHIYIINDATPTGQRVQGELEAVLPIFEDEVDFTMLLNPSPADLQQLRNLPNDSLILLILLNRDSEGTYYTYEEGIQLISGLTNRPVYGLWDFYLDWGLVGGMLTNAGLQGRTAAEMAIQVLNGADVRRIPILEQSPNRFMFDYEQLSRFGVPLSSVPKSTAGIGGADTVILNRPTTFMEEYGTTIAGAVGVIVIALGVVLLQRNSLVKQQAIEDMLRRTNRELEEARSSMEVQVKDRTRDLEERSRQLQIASTVAREAAGIRDVDALMETVVALVSESFGLYHTGIFLLDEGRERAVLRAASSEGGRSMIARGHSLRVGQEGIVGSVSQTGEARIALDVMEDRVWLNTSELGDTRSEMALPLKVQSRVIGVLDLQSREPGAFGRDDIAVLSIVADQLALAIENARLLQESRDAIGRLEESYNERMNAIWTGAGDRVYHYDGFEVEPVGAVDAKQREDGLVVPIVLRGQQIGSIALRRQDNVSEWSDEEKALAEVIGIQAGLALENAQLVSESRTRAQRERVLADISTRIRETLDMDVILQTALREIGQNLGVSTIEVRMEQADGV